MTQLSRFTVNPTQREARRALASPQVLHAIVSGAFVASDSQGAAVLQSSNDRAQLESRVLWRLDPGQTSHTLYIVSEASPDFEHLAGQLGGTPSDGSTIAYSAFLNRLDVGQEWQFRLKANPTKDERLPGSHSVRKGLLRHDDQVAWLMTRAEQLGFTVPLNRLAVAELVISDSSSVAFSRRGQTVTLATAVFDGFLRVSDPLLLRQALTAGIGRAKGYGYGLLTLAPARKY